MHRNVIKLGKTAVDGPEWVHWSEYEKDVNRMKKIVLSAGVCAALFWLPFLAMAAPAGAEQPLAVPAQQDVPAASEQEVFSLVNAYRVKLQDRPLVWDAELAKAAKIRAQEMQQNFSHERPNGHSCFSVMKQQGIAYERAGENLVRGDRLTPTDAVREWIDSPTHCRNIRLRSFTHTAVASFTAVDGKVYFVQLFIQKKGPQVLSYEQEISALEQEGSERASNQDVQSEEKT